MRVLTMMLVVTLVGCGATVPEQRPADFALTYNWIAGSMPPPYHYEYTIDIAADGGGTIKFQPDYSDELVWTETFTLTPTQLDDLYAMLRDHGVFSTSWRAQDNPPVGGSHEQMSISANGTTTRVPFFPADGEVALQPVYAAINDLVPTATWDKLKAQHKQYQEQRQ